jgi:hypothetical protein
MKTKNKKETRGGKRPFSGRKKADYKTKILTFRVRLEWVDEIKALVKSRIEQFKTETL